MDEKKETEDENENGTKTKDGNENGTKTKDGNETEDEKETIDENKKFDEENQQQNDVETREKEEKQFLRLFSSVLNAIMNFKCVNEANVNPAISLIKKSFTNKTFNDVKFTEWENICGYLYRFGSHGAGFARFRILHAIRNCENLEKVLKKSDLRVICLGSGPGNDAVGFCSALSEFQYPNTLKITVVDKFEEWSLCLKLAKMFIGKDVFGNVSELFRRTNVDMSFLQVDLPGTVKSDKEYFQNLADADVILISKLLSILDVSNDKESEKAIIKSLQENMKEDAVIILNDTFYEYLWIHNFIRCYSWGDDEKDTYKSLALAEWRFNSNDDVPSKLPITVLMKRHATFLGN